MSIKKQQNLKFWRVKMMINHFKYRMLIILAEDEVNAISDMMKYMRKEGFDKYDLWQYSYKVLPI